MFGGPAPTTYTNVVGQMLKQGENPANNKQQEEALSNRTPSPHNFPKTFHGHCPFFSRFSFFRSLAVFFLGFLSFLVSRPLDIFCLLLMFVVIIVTPRNVEPLCRQIVVPVTVPVTVVPVVRHKHLLDHLVE